MRILSALSETTDAQHASSRLRRADPEASRAVSLRFALPLLDPKPRDETLRTHRPTRIAQDETHRVVTALVELLPRLSLVGRHIGARCARGDPHFPVRQIRNRRP